MISINHKLIFHVKDERNSLNQACSQRVVFGKKQKYLKICYFEFKKRENIAAINRKQHHLLIVLSLIYSYRINLYKPLCAQFLLFIRNSQATHFENRLNYLTMETHEDANERRNNNIIRPFNKKSFAVTMNRSCNSEQNQQEQLNMKSTGLNFLERKRTPQRKKFINEEFLIKESKLQVKKVNKQLEPYQSEIKYFKVQKTERQKISNIEAKPKTAFQKQKDLNPEFSTLALKPTKGSLLIRQSFSNSTLPQYKALNQSNTQLRSEGKQKSQAGIVHQILRVIYGAVLSEESYRLALVKYNKMKGSILNSSQKFNLQQKLLQDIILSIKELKNQTSICQNSKRGLPYKDNNKKSTSNGQYTNLYPQNSFQESVITKSKQQQLAIQQLEKQLQVKQKKIKKFQKKVQELELQINRLKQQCEHLHRLNESKYSQIFDLKKQLQEQESFLQEQVSVMEELEKSVCFNNSTFINLTTFQDNANNENIFGQANSIIQNCNFPGFQKQQLFQEGKHAALRQVLEEIESEIESLRKKQHDKQSYKKLSQKRQQSNSTLHPHDQQAQQLHPLEFYYPLQNELMKKQQATIHNQNNQTNASLLFRKQNNCNPNYLHDFDDGIEQLDISFERVLEVATQTNLDYLHCQQSENCYENLEDKKNAYLLDEDISLIECSSNNPNYLTEMAPVKEGASFSNFFQTSVQEFSFLSTNPGRYLQTIQTMTQQLAEAYETINSLRSKVSNQEENNQRITSNYQWNKFNRQVQKKDSYMINGQEHCVNSVKPNNKVQKNTAIMKKLGLNFSFWK